MAIVHFAQISVVHNLSNRRDETVRDRAIMSAELILFARSGIARRCSLLAASLLLIVIPACKSLRQPVIAVVPQTTAQEVWESEHAGVESAAQALNWDVYWNAPSREDDFPRQIQIVNAAIDRKVSGLILSPDHAVALISPVRSALARGIPTVIVGSPLGTSPGGNLVFVVNDDAATGRLAAERASQYLKPGDAVAILGVNSSILGSIERTDAFEASLRQRIPAVRVIERRSTSFSFAEAEETAEETIRSVPGLRVILTLNINQTRAADGALREERYPGKILLIGCDQDLDLMHHLRSGGIDAVIAENTYEMGYDAVHIIHQLRMGERTDAKVVVEPVLVTRENIDSAAVQHVLDMNWRVQ